MLFRPSRRIEDFEEAAMPHMNDIFRTACRLTGDRDRAGDVVQEVYMQAWKSFDKFEIGTNCRAWLFKILFHTLHHFRRKWFNARIVKDGEDVLEFAQAGPAPLPDKITDKDILTALDRIPADFRSVVLLADVEEFAYKEVAGILEIPIGTVMSRLSRGRKLLRELLAETAVSYGVVKGERRVEGQIA
ncbi:MAG: sigma-70 family RNA polymerase sigma factor [Bryobacteraceae bacterium]